MSLWGTNWVGSRKCCHLFPTTLLQVMRNPTVPEFEPRNVPRIQTWMNSLILMGGIGHNDYSYVLKSGRSIEEMQSLVPLVINVIALAIKELIELGAVTLIVPGNLPSGCSPSLLTSFASSIKADYDPETGCLARLNEFSKYHNQMLRKELDRIRELYPHATIIYADYYNAAIRFYRSPIKFGFRGRALSACCGVGGPYNFNSSAQCGSSLSSACDDPASYISWDGFSNGVLRACCGRGGPYNFNNSARCGYIGSKACSSPSTYANWDGVHLTEAAYRYIAMGFD
ncbi:hypothetical protein Acr_00g0101250 [Actinidia rufa]|uniref:GDSL-like Lipase/Acylhydrolase superfamily protein n=1 Tax=Actinidia rufa TaxID=165716 RepID=A0A7J0E0D4_9ERIC|nr:hypothetical protein Acr_00g0101250 [Actinidia rufa]